MWGGSAHCFLCSPFYVKGVSLSYVGRVTTLKDLKDLVVAAGETATGILHDTWCFETAAARFHLCLHKTGLAIRHIYSKISSTTGELYRFTGEHSFARAELEITTGTRSMFSNGSVFLFAVERLP